MDYIQTLNYWGNSYWGGGYWGAIGTRRSEIFRINLVMNLNVLALGLLAMSVPATQLINFSIVTDTYDELEEV